MTDEKFTPAVSEAVNKEEEGGGKTEPFAIGQKWRAVKL
jgi:hypothetical protein